MSPTNGFESERMMAEIEAFLRTGEAPPAAPEPQPVRVSPPLPTRPFDLDEVEFFSDRPADPGRRPQGRGLRGGPAGPAARARHLRSLASGRLASGRLASGRGVPGRRGGSRLPGRYRPPAEPPRWTALRVFVVATLLLGLMVLTVIWSNHASSTNPDGADRASTAPAGPGYAFVRVDKTNRPFRWNPCQAIHYRTDLASAPVWAATDLQTAVEQISVATGILFVDDGDSGAAPTDPSALGTAAQPAPVVVDWATRARADQLGIAQDGPGTEGLARTRPVASVDEMTGHGVFVTGSVVIDPKAASLPAGFVTGGLGVLLVQQLAHLVGLGYTDAPGQVMNPGVLTSRVTVLGAGDRAGLTRLGTASGCLTPPAGGTLEPSM